MRKLRWVIVAGVALAVGWVVWNVTYYAVVGYLIVALADKI